MGVLGASHVLLRTSVHGVGIGADEVQHIPDEERTRLSYDGTEILSLLDARLGLDAEILLDDPDGRIWRLSSPAADAAPPR